MPASVLDFVGPGDALLADRTSPDAWRLLQLWEASSVSTHTCTQHRETTMSISKHHCTYGCVGGAGAGLHPALLFGDAANGSQKQLAAQRIAHKQYLESVKAHAENFKKYHKQKRKKETNNIVKKIATYHADKKKLQEAMKEKEERERIRRLKDCSVIHFMCIHISSKHVHLCIFIMYASTCLHML